MKKFIVAISLIIFASASALFNFEGTVFAEKNNISSTYYYAQLDPLSKVFYNAMTKMEESGDFKKGNAMFEVSSKDLSHEQLSSHVNGNPAVSSSFQKARDAFISDNSNVFYVDFTKLTLRVGKVDTQFKAYLCAGSNENFFAEGITTENLEESINLVNNEIERVVNLANLQTTDVEKIRAVHNELVNNIDYKYEHEAGEDSMFVHSAYGALVTRKSVCEGYAIANKLILDKLGFENITVIGFASSSPNNTSSHMWNYIKLSEKWFGIDATWNDPIGGLPRELYFLKGAETFDLKHLAKQQVSPNGFVFEVPTLEFIDFGTTVEKSGFKVLTFEESVVDKETSELIRYTKYIASYNNMGPLEINKTGLSFVMRVFDIAKNDWFPWVKVDEGIMVDIKNNSMTIMLYNHPSIQFAITDMIISDKAINFQIPEDKLVAISDVYANKFAGMYSPPPYIKKITPTVERYLYAEGTYDVVSTYNQTLKLDEGYTIDGDKKPSIQIIYENEQASKYTEVTNFAWNQTNKDTISFTFKPSPMYAHDRLVYKFKLVGLVGETSNKTPMNINYLVMRPMTCSYYSMPGYGVKYFKTVVGEPQLIVDKDLSAEGWVDEENKPISDKSLFNIVMVTSKPSTETQAEIEKNLQGIENATISQTYDIKLNVCNKKIGISKGSFVTILLGFPEGLDASSVGVKYDIYHFSEGPNGTLIPEIIPCVVTPYGLIAKVTSFSPFAVVVKKDTTPSVKKTIFVSTEDGGTLDKTGVHNINEAESFELTITPSSTSSIESIVLNGEKQKIDNVDGFKLVLSENKLTANNNLNITYVNKEIIEIEKSNGIEAITPVVKVYNSTVKPAKPIITQNLSKNIVGKVNSSLTLRVQADTNDEGVLSYQWYKNGLSINNYTSELIIEKVDKTDINSEYHVEVFNTLNGQVEKISSQSTKIVAEPFVLNTTLIILLLIIIASAIIAGVVAIVVNKKRVV